jgi:hypothetical protein
LEGGREFMLIREHRMKSMRLETGFHPMKRWRLDNGA